MRSYPSVHSMLSVTTKEKNSGKPYPHPHPDLSQDIQLSSPDAGLKTSKFKSPRMENHSRNHPRKKFQNSDAKCTRGGQPSFMCFT